jgi:hypothetical protein
MSKHSIFAAGLLAAVATLSSHHASAAELVAERAYSDGDSWGSTKYFQAAYSWDGTWYNKHGAYANSQRRTYSGQNFAVRGAVLGYKFTAVNASVTGLAQADFPSNRPTYSQNQFGTLQLAGQTVFVSGPSHSPCSSSSTTGCLRYSKSINVTLLSGAKISFTVGPVPVTLKSSVVAGLNGDLRATTASYESSGAFSGQASTRLAAGGRITSKNSLDVGVEYIAQFGAGVNIDLINLQLSSDIKAWQLTRRASDSWRGAVAGERYGQAKETPVLSTLNGSVSVNAKLLGGLVWSWSKEVYSWTGYTWDSPWVDDVYNETF